MALSGIKIIDSHTGGEPTRVVIEGFPDLGGGLIGDKLTKFESEYDFLRRGLIDEPRGFPAIVGALLCEPDSDESDAGVIFFNNGGFLGMCGHGTIGVVKTLEHMGRLHSEVIRLDTPAGVVEAAVNEDGSVAVRNVESYRHLCDVEISIENSGVVRGDVAWGGNWFFLVKNYESEVSMQNLAELVSYSGKVVEELAKRGVTGKDGSRVDHIEIFGDSGHADSKNFVLCPGGEYDRSPCGTGTSAKLACLAADGNLPANTVWSQESITGSVFEASYINSVNGVIPTITGTAHITAESTLFFDKDDPFRFGFQR